MKMTRPVTVPSPEVVRQHDLSHCQYRNWCPICVAGAADDRSHEIRQVLEGSCPEVGSDYGFLRNRRGDKLYKPLLVSKARKVGAFAAHMVPKKGVGGGWIVQQYLRDLKKWGLRHKLLLRSDGEPAIIDLLTACATCECRRLCWKAALRPTPALMGLQSGRFRVWKNKFVCFSWLWSATWAARWALNMGVFHGS